MKQSIEEAAKQYAQKYFDLTNGGVIFNHQIFKDRKENFIAGAEFADASKEEPKGLEELRIEFRNILISEIPAHISIDRANSILDRTLPYLRVANQIQNNEDAILNEIEMMDSLVEYPHGREHCILPEHYKKLAKNLSGVSNTQSSDAVFTARDMENFAAKMLLTFDKSRTLKDELNIFCEKDMEGITPVEKEPCKCLCHISEGVTMHMFPCCEETNKKH